MTPSDTLPTGLAGVAQRLSLGPRLHPTAFVAPSATVIGDVTIEEEASIWFRGVVRGDINRIVIGARSNIQDCAVIHLADQFPAIIGERVTVGHSAIVHACTIGDEVLIGMGAIILDGAEIGARSIIGANALVTAGTKIPPGSLVLGSPGKVARQLSLDEQAKIKSWAVKYVENAKLFRQHLEQSSAEKR
jgi:carbonic anhydrase/acetyltransferase-like protein (isoleucine patch superfamily)